MLPAAIVDSTIAAPEPKLKAGDILRTDKSQGAELLLMVNGMPKFRAKPGTYKGRKAVSLTRFAQPQERI